MKNNILISKIVKALLLQDEKILSEILNESEISKEQILDFIKKAQLLSDASLLYRKIMRKYPDILFKQDLIKIESLNLENIIIQKKLKKELTKLAELFFIEEIYFILLKGESLNRIYSKKNLTRCYNDIDLLVAPESIEKARNVLSKLYNKHSDFYGDFFSHHYIYFKKGIKIELHKNLVYPTAPFHISVKDLFNRSTHFYINSFKINSLSAEDSLNYLCIHVSFHNIFSLSSKYFNDILKILAIYKIKWNVLLKISKNTKTEAFLFYVLSLIKRYLNQQIPSDFLVELKKTSNKSQLSLLEQFPFEKIILKTDSGRGISRFYYEFLLTRPRDRLRLSLRPLFFRLNKFDNIDS